MEEPDEKNLDYQNCVFFHLHSAPQKNGFSHFTWVQLLLGATHPMSQGIRSKQYHSCIHSCKDSFYKNQGSNEKWIHWDKRKIQCHKGGRISMSTWGSVPPSCRDVYFNYISCRMNISSLWLGPNIHPHSILEGLGNLPRRDIFTYVLLMHHIILYLLLSKKDPIEATLIYDSLLRFQFRVRHDRLKCKSVFWKGGFLIIPR